MSQPADSRASTEAMEAVRFQRDVLHPLGPVRLLVDEVGRGESGGNVAEFGVDLGHDVVLRAGNPGRFRVLLPVDRGRPGQQASCGG